MVIIGEGNAALASKGAFSDAPHRILCVDISCELAAVTAAPASAQIPNCPDCKTGKVELNGKRLLENGGEIQRYICKSCGRRFQDKVLKSKKSLTSTRKICARGAKNLHVPKRKHYGTGELSDELKAMITVLFKGWLEKEGYKDNRYPCDVKTLAYLGANLSDPEDVKAKIGAHKVKDGTKMLLTYSYEAFMNWHNSIPENKKLSWERPTYKQEENIPFVPDESELDQIIAAAQSKRMAAYLQTLKETFTDPSEALGIDRDEDIQGRIIYIRHPVKDHRPRTLEVSEKCIAMINMLPRNPSGKVFDARYYTMCDAFCRLKKRVAIRTKNDRIRHIELTSFRTFGGTKIAMLSNGNAMTVMKFLGLKRYENAMRYVNIWMLSFRTETEYEHMAVTSPEELKIALDGGFEFVIEKFGASWFRRPKRIAIAGTPINQRPNEQIQSLETPITKRKDAIISF